jgi:hypothetical protein
MRDAPAGWPPPVLVASLLTVLFGTIHVADEIARGEQYTEPGLLLLVPVVMIVYLYGASLALKENNLGYWTLIVISAVGFYSVFLAHAFELSGAPGAEEIAIASGPFFVWVIIMQGAGALAVLVLSVTALVRLRWMPR